jgi:hypothetical protein
VNLARSQLKRWAPSLKFRFRDPHGDPTWRGERLKAFVEELRQRLQQRLAARRSKEEIKTRARELWEQNGRPVGRDVEFWLQAERQLNENE